MNTIRRRFDVSVIMMPSTDEQQTYLFTYLLIGKVSEISYRKSQWMHKQRTVSAVHGAVSDALVYRHGQSPSCSQEMQIVLCFSAVYVILIKTV